MTKIRKEMEELTALLEARLDRLEALVRNGGKESRYVERVPAWRDEDCDTECELTGVRLPKKFVKRVGKLRVHPGVADFAEERKIENLEENLNLEVPEDYLVTPDKFIFRKMYRPPTTLEWDLKMLPKVKRPGLMLLSTEMGLGSALEAAGYSADFRDQSNEWLRLALRAIRKGEPLPKPESSKSKGPPAKATQKPKTASKKTSKKSGKKSGKKTAKKRSKK